MPVSRQVCHLRSQHRSPGDGFAILYLIRLNMDFECCRLVIASARVKLCNITSDSIAHCFSA